MLQISNTELKEVQNALYEFCGIYLNDTKQTMIKNRLTALLRTKEAKDIDSIPQLLKSIRSNLALRQAFINSFTTNKTDFFRESYHFDDMIDRSLNILMRESLPVKIFCSASSSGEEPYSIAATCLYAKSLYKSNSSIRIIATDIDTNMLELARKGHYTLDTRLNKIPSWVELDKYFDVKKQGDGTLELDAKSSLKSLITFQPLNLYNKHYPFPSNDFDIVFCRNVLIYFKIHDQEAILERLLGVLKPGGTLYLGHSEDVLALGYKVERLGNKTFIKRDL
ncbi:protein-glutamate O-methyltransferase CheR [Helicobacter sp. 11S02629-2]|uniref:CheR family methyltransferase n=1 Tax=Helicobacter sp. 11S02629-2 TaxID=1476195 RepID=UPI000BA771E9|nr:protein-glutamate O-methyltransferase CheR [Helicobacter sp. 11S02629-2]PAF45269.1 chemotaxis protein [Helicobacter sp. 11S02629-2]